MRTTRTFSREDRLPNGRVIGTCTSDAFTEDGKVWRWVENPKAIIPPDVCREYGILCGGEQQAAYDAHLDAFLTEYRERDAEPDAEQVSEMRAAFGLGVTVVNVITGRRTQL